MTKQHRQSGFTAVELLVTLFVAAAFLVAAYQLFNIVIKDGGQARAETRAGNVAYDYMRRYAPYATSPCTTLTPLTDSSVSIDGLSNAKISISITCPITSTPAISKIEATINYNTPTQTVRYATYTNGASGAIADVTDGLVAWWKFNGNAAASVGNTDGVVTGASLTTGQNGLANGAYSFNGTASQYITYNSTFGLGTGNFSISTWVNPATSSGAGQFIKVSSSGPNGYGIGMGASSFDNSNSGNKIVLLYENVRWIVTTATITTGWHHVVMTVDASGVPSVYYDGVLNASYPGAAPIAPTTNSVTSGQSGSMATNRAFNGAVDDMRIYNRPLTATEIQTLYSSGAK